MKKSKTNDNAEEEEKANEGEEDGEGEKEKRIYGAAVGEKAYNLAADLLVLFSGRLVQEDDDEELNNVILPKRMDPLQECMVEYFKESMFSGMINIALLMLCHVLTF